MTNERHKQLGRCIPETLREKRNVQWVDIEQIIGDPQISELRGDIDREEIDDAATHNNRANAPDAIKIETKLNDGTSAEYIMANSENCKGRNMAQEYAQITTQRQTETLKPGPWKTEKKERK